MKKYIWIIISIIITTVILIVINNMIYGTDIMYIADYEPPCSLSEEPWELVKFRRTISDMKIAIVIGLVITAYEPIRYRKLFDIETTFIYKFSQMPRI